MTQDFINGIWVKNYQKVQSYGPWLCASISTRYFLLTSVLFYIFGDLLLHFLHCQHSSHQFQSWTRTGQSYKLNKPGQADFIKLFTHYWHLYQMGSQARTTQHRNLNQTSHLSSPYDSSYIFHERNLNTNFNITIFINHFTSGRHTFKNNKHLKYNIG